MRMVGTGLAAVALAWTAPAAAQGQCPWQPVWASSQMAPDTANALPADSLSDASLRQIVRVSQGGDRVRVRLSNAFGRDPLVIRGASIARAAASDRADIAGAIVPLTFAGRPDAVVPAGADWLSDPAALPVAAFADVAITLHIARDPNGQTGHPGSRATSYLARGDATRTRTMTGATTVDRWYMLSGVETQDCGHRGAVAVLGDSITDGRGSTTNRNDRWTDFLARRLAGDRATRGLAVLNQGIGGNRVLADGLGPNAMARLERDVLAQPGVRHLIVLEGINDIGTLTREKPATPAQHAALVAQVTGAYAQIVARARVHGIRVYGATILPFMGTDYYHPDAANEADRQAINAWIRAPGNFDGVIDLDQAMRDPARPAWLNPRYDSGDRLHPSPDGFRAMANAVPLSLFTAK